MTFVIAAAGTGGHVFPGLAVGEALVDLGVARDEVLYVGGDRLEATIYPRAGFPFLGLELRGLKRSLTMRNLSLPRLMWRARARILGEMQRRAAQVALGMGGYVTIPTALAARKLGLPLLIAEQNAGAGLANRVAARWAVRSFTSFPTTHGLERGEWVGNPVRRSLAEFDRERLRDEGMSRYQLAGSSPVLGIFGGSLGAGVINAAARELVSSWSGPAMQVVHLTGQGHGIETEGDSLPVTWRRIEFEERMDLFYAVADLVVARAGGGVAELTATGTPAILIPGEFGSSGHQTANAAFLRDAGAAVVLAQDRIEELAGTVNRLLFDKPTLNRMREAAEGIARPRAASTIASAMLGLAG